MGQCSCADGNGQSVATPTSTTPPRFVHSAKRGSSPPSSQKAFKKFDAAVQMFDTSEGGNAIRNALGTAKMQASTVTAAVPRAIRPKPDDEASQPRSAPIPVSTAAPSSRNGFLHHATTSSSTLLQVQVEAFCRLLLSSQRPPSGEASPSMAPLINAIELSARVAAVAPHSSMDEFGNNDSDDGDDAECLTAGVLEHHSAVYAVLFSLLKTGDFISNRPNKLVNNSNAQRGGSPTSPPPAHQQAFATTRTYRQTGSAEQTASNFDDTTNDTQQLSSDPSASVHIMTAVQISKSLLSQYFLRPIGAIVCLAAQRIGIPHDVDGWGHFGRSLAAPTGLQHRSQHNASCVSHDDPLKHNTATTTRGEHSPPVALSQRGESLSTSRCTSPSHFRSSSAQLAQSGSNQFSPNGHNDQYADEAAANEDELFARLHQWAVAAHRRRRRTTRLETTEDESSLEDVDALVGLAGKGYRCKEPTNQEREERLTRGIAKAKLNGVLDVDPSDRRHRSGSSKQRPAAFHKHGLGQVESLSASAEQEQCLRYPSQAQQHLLFAPPANTPPVGHPKAFALSAASPDDTTPGVAMLLQRQGTDDTSHGGVLRSGDVVEVEDVHMSVFLPPEALLESGHHQHPSDMHHALRPTQGNSSASTGQHMSSHQQSLLQQSSLKDASGANACLQSQLSMSLHGNTSSTFEERWEAAVCLDAHQFSRTAGWDDSHSAADVESGSTARHFLRSEPQTLALIGLGAQRGVLMQACCTAIADAAKQQPHDSVEMKLSACFQRAMSAIPTTLLPSTAHLALPTHLDAPQSPRAPGADVESCSHLPPIGFDVVAPLCGSLPNTYARLLLLPCITPALEHSDIPMGLRMLLTYSGLLCLPLRHPPRKGNSPHLPGSSSHFSHQNQNESRARWSRSSPGGPSHVNLSASSSAVGSSVQHLHPPLTTDDASGMPTQPTAVQRGVQQISPGGAGFSRSSWGSSAATASTMSASLPSSDINAQWHRDEELLYWLIVQWRTNGEPEPIIDI